MGEGVIFSKVFLKDKILEPNFIIKTNQTYKTPSSHNLETTWQISTLIKSIVNKSQNTLKCTREWVKLTSGSTSMFIPAPSVHLLHD